MKFASILILGMVLAGCSLSEPSEKDFPALSPEETSLQDSKNDDLELDVLEAQLQEIDVDDFQL